jgi:hypothetical protein
MRKTTAAVVYGRNDGYKEDERGLINLTSLLETFDEVIYVDWNSEEYSFIYNIIDKLPKTGRLTHYAIPPNIVNQLVNNDPDAIPCISVLPQNIAIRRCNKDYIACVAMDILPPSKKTLDGFISKADENTFYTFSRRETDYDKVVENKDSIDKYRKYLDKTSEPRKFIAKVTPNDNYSLINCCGDFQLASKKVWEGVKGHEESMIYSCFQDTNVQKKAILNNFKLEAIFDVPLYHMSHKGNTVPQGGDMNTLHEITKKRPPKFNDAWKYVEYFSQTENLDSWGFSDIEIESETI